jgi:hypothetical protein
MNLAVTGVAAVAMAIGSVSALAGYDPPQTPAKTSFGRAISICSQYVNSNKSPGDVSESDYQDYIRLRDEALAADPKLVEWDTPYLGKVAKDLYPRCEKLASAYVAGVDAEKKPTLLTSCAHNTEARLNTIMQTYYPEFEKKGAGATSLFLPRKDLEAARYYMYKKDGWYTTGGCATNDHYKAAFAPLIEKFQQAEALVKKMEQAKGVRFERVERKGTASSLIFVDVKTGKEVPQSVANR